MEYTSKKKQVVGMLLGEDPVGERGGPLMRIFG